MGCLFLQELKEMHIQTVMVSRNHVFHQLSALLCKSFTSRLRCSSKPSCWLFNHHVYSASSEMSVHEPVARSRPTRCLPCRLKGCNVRVISNSNYQSNYPPLPPFSSNCANVCWFKCSAAVLRADSKGSSFCEF